jgi:hypothetical protein
MGSAVPLLNYEYRCGTKYLITAGVTQPSLLELAVGDDWRENLVQVVAVDTD